MGSSFSYISSRVGVRYRISVISRNGAWRTELEMKFNPSMTLSSQVAWSRFETHEATQMSNLIMMIYNMYPSASHYI